MQMNTNTYPTITQYTNNDFALSYVNINELETLSLYDMNIIEYN
jgi:hypothetical protein